MKKTDPRGRPRLAPGRGLEKRIAIRLTRAQYADLQAYWESYSEEEGFDARTLSGFCRSALLALARRQP